MELFIYFTRSAIVLFLFLAIYRLFLRSDAHYAANRFFLLLGLIASLGLPLVELHYTVIVEAVEQPSALVPVAPVGATSQIVAIEQAEGFNWMHILINAYIGIMMFFMLRLLFLFGKMLRLIQQSEKLIMDGAVICINEQVEMPFVFGNRIFVKDAGFLSLQKQEILTHERVHLFQYHWIDVFISELLIVVQWFNPLAWYYARVVKQNLEFLADQGVLKKGFKLEKYIQHIICETMGAEASVLANHFRFSQNKRRLKMMKNDKKSKWRLLKLLLVLPLIGGVLWAFSEPVYEYRSNPEATNTSAIQDKKATFLMKGKVVVVDDTSVRDNEKMTVAKKPLSGTSIVIKGTTRGCVADMKGEFELEVSENDVLVLSFVGYETQQIKVDRGMPKVITMVSSAYELKPSEIKVRPKEDPVIEPNTKDGKPVFYVVEEMPSYKEGEGTFAKKLQKKVEAVKRKEPLSGKVKVQFIVAEDGQLKDIKAISRAGEKEAKYAVQIITELNDWMPGKQRGKAVATKIVVPVEFD